MSESPKSEQGPNVRDLADRWVDYQNIVESAMTKVAKGSYRSEDLIDDWFSWWGRAARDMTAVAAISYRSAQATAASRRPPASQMAGEADSTAPEAEPNTGEGGLR